MWKEIVDNNDLLEFLKRVCCFHDSCIKEIKYVSGAYVDEKLSMYPVNDQRLLRVIIQRQFEDDSMIEMEFVGLRQLRLFPITENYTCEILDATMILKDDSIYWCDCGGLSENDLANYDGTLICASKLRWRTVAGHMGNKEYFVESF